MSSFPVLVLLMLTAIMLMFFVVYSKDDELPVSHRSPGRISKSGDAAAGGHHRHNGR